jgi:hypothetical protein
VLHNDESAKGDADPNFRNASVRVPACRRHERCRLKSGMACWQLSDATTAYEFGHGATSQIGALLLRLDPRVLDDFGPFDNIGFDDDGEFLGRTNNRIETQLGKFFAYIG